MEQTMTLKLRIVLLLLGSALLVAPAVEAQEIGKREYLNNCAVCHGTLGKGDGPFAAQLKKTPADLTKIEKNNLGVFPFDRIYEIIDGREAVAAHGPRDMPVWGDRYSAEAAGLTFGFGTPKDLESFVRGRIIALIGYLYSLQAK
jgi:mono/diheme cytochrome c family protein